MRGAAEPCGSRGSNPPKTDRATLCAGICQHGLGMRNGPAWILSAEESRELDRRACDELGIPVRDLMERAGEMVVQALLQMATRERPVVFLCGKGNNGGDGLVAARLAHKSRYRTVCLIVAKAGDLSPDAKLQAQRAQEAGVKLVFIDDPDYQSTLSSLSECSLIVDALLGTGAKGKIEGDLLDAIHAINASGVPVLSVDIPSGIECDTGRELGASVRANRTVTFGTAKPYLFQNAGVERSGVWTVADIGFPEALLNQPRSAMLLNAHWVEERLPSRKKDSHKGANGSVLIVAGSRNMPGAAALAARAAYRAGAGLVTVAAVPSVCAAVAAHTPEAIFITLPEYAGDLHSDAAYHLLKHGRGYDSAVFGPGMSLSNAACDFLSQVWESWATPCVLDADALNAICTGVRPPQSACVMTPHPGEMARLLSTDAKAIQADRFGAVRQASAKFGKAVLLKGAYSLVSEGTEPLIVNATGNPGMAAAGMGDVLSGVIGTLLAQGLSPKDAAACGMFWHGLAGDLCAHETGSIGFRASEVADALPKARATITSTCDYPQF